MDCLPTSLQIDGPYYLREVFPSKAAHTAHGNDSEALAAFRKVKAVLADFKDPNRAVDVPRAVLTEGAEAAALTEAAFLACVAAEAAGGSADADADADVDVAAENSGNALRSKVKAAAVAQDGGGQCTNGAGPGLDADAGAYFGSDLAKAGGGSYTTSSNLDSNNNNGSSNNGSDGLDKDPSFGSLLAALSSSQVAAGGGGGGGGDDGHEEPAAAADAAASD